MRNTLKSQLGYKIRDLRRIRGLTGKELSKRTGFSESAISKFERGILKPTASFLKKVSAALELSVSEIATLEEQRLLLQRELDGTISVQNESFTTQIDAASNVRTFSSQSIPDTLQSKEYNQSVACSKTEAGTILKKSILSETPGASQKFILGEAILRTYVQSPSVMREQLFHLISIIDDSHDVELRILPFDKILSVIPSSDFSIYDERIVEIKTCRTHTYFWLDDDVQHYIRLMNYLFSCSLAPLLSRKMILDAARSFA